MEATIHWYKWYRAQHKTAQHVNNWKRNGLGAVNVAPHSCINSIRPTHSHPSIHPFLSRSRSLISGCGAEINNSDEFSLHVRERVCVCDARPRRTRRQCSVVCAGSDHHINGKWFAAVCCIRLRCVRSTRRFLSHWIFIASALDMSRVTLATRTYFN